MGVKHHSRVRGAWMWVTAVGVPVMVTWSWTALQEWDVCSARGDNTLAWAPLFVVSAGVLVGGMNVVAAAVGGSASVRSRIFITVASCGLVLWAYVLWGLVLVEEPRFHRFADGYEGFSGNSAVVMLAGVVVSLIAVVMMWLSSRPSSGAGPRWWESVAVQVIAAGILIAGVLLTAAYWVWATQSCQTLWESPDTTWTRATVIRWVDGDTVVTTEGTIRLIGVDAPETGECGSAKATKLAEKIAPAGSVVRLGKRVFVDDRDGDDRKLRYVETKSNDVDIAAEQIRNGSKAGDDVRDGYDWHPREAKYRRLDRNNADYSCVSTAKPTTSGTNTGAGGSQPNS